MSSAWCGPGNGNWAFPSTFEWVHEINSGLRSAAVAAGLQVRDLPLMVRRDAFPPLAPDGFTVRMMPADDEALPAVLAAIGVGFGDPGTAVGVAGPVDRDAAIDRDGQRRDATRREIVDGLFGVAAAEVDWCDAGRRWRPQSPRDGH